MHLVKVRVEGRQQVSSRPSMAAANRKKRPQELTESKPAIKLIRCKLIKNSLHLLVDERCILLCSHPRIGKVCRILRTRQPRWSRLRSYCRTASVHRVWGCKSAFRRRIWMVFRRAGWRTGSKRSKRWRRHRRFLSNRKGTQAGFASLSRLVLPTRSAAAANQLSVNASWSTSHLLASRLK
jgi:hypothetical protein